MGVPNLKISKFDKSHYPELFPHYPDNELINSVTVRAK